MKNLFFLAVAVLLTGHTVLQAQPSVQNIIKNQRLSFQHFETSGISK